MAELITAYVFFCPIAVAIFAIWCCRAPKAPPSVEQAEWAK
jgi:hypothetical protein